MSPRVFLHFAGLAMLLVVSVLELSSAVLTAQVTVSAGPIRLNEVKTIYIAPRSDDFMGLLKSRLEKWGAVHVTAQVEEADAILTCETESRIVPAKVVVRIIDAQVRLVDRHSQKLIWSTKKSTSWDSKLADDIIDQLKKDRERSFSNY
ncbi:MAG: hypothetical protein WA741_15495 [Candidatus Sulfotelmatobacter sp.]